MLRSSYQERDAPSAVLALTIIAERWPETLGTLPRSQVSYGLRAAQEDSERYRLYRAMVASAPGRKVAGGGFIWRELALLQLAHGERPAALASLSSITDPYVIVAVEADKRFDGVRANIAPPLDVQRGANQTIEAAREQCQQHPDQLFYVTELMQDLISTARFADALQVADAAVAKASGPQGPSAYSDYNQLYVWLLDYRARLLARLGRWTDAVQQLEAATRVPESGGSNVSQVISLAGLYNDLGQPQAARQTLQRLPPRLSAYGAMQQALEQLRSAVQLGDEMESTRALFFLREHQADARSTYERGLLEVGEPDDAGQVLIKELQDPKQRTSALLHVQHFARAAVTPRQEESHQRWQTMQALPEVREAIAAVGHVASYPVTQPPRGAAGP
jgi:tetratricopeptide (TPR) repeat protein